MKSLDSITQWAAWQSPVEKKPFVVMIIISLILSCIEENVEQESSSFLSWGFDEGSYSLNINRSVINVCIW